MSPAFRESVAPPYPPAYPVGVRGAGGLGLGGGGGQEEGGQNRRVSQSSRHPAAADGSE